MLKSWRRIIYCLCLPHTETLGPRPAPPFSGNNQPVMWGQLDVNKVPAQPQSLFILDILTVTYLRRNLLFSLCALSCHANHAMQQMLISCVLCLCLVCPVSPVSPVCPVLWDDLYHRLSQSARRPWPEYWPSHDGDGWVCPTRPTLGNSLLQRCECRQLNDEMS